MPTMRYLIIQYFTKPGGKIDESMTVAKRIKPKDLQMSNIILDFKELKVIKCYMNGTSPAKDWDVIVSYFYKYYSATIERLFEVNGHPISITAQSNETTQSMVSE
jgi:hypothetical protein